MLQMRQPAAVFDWPMLLSIVTGASILLYAATAKVLTSQVSPLSSVRTNVLISGELLLGLWLLTGVYSRAACSVALVVFTSFATYNALKLIHGDSTPCGCFGRRSLHPAAGLALDGSAVLAFLSTISVVQRRMGRFAPRLFVPAFVATSGLTILFASPISPAQHSLIAQQDVAWGYSCFAALSNQDASLNSGTWRIVIIQHDCEKCRRFLDRLASIQTRSSDVRLCIAEIRPFAGELERKFLFPPSASCAKLEEAGPPCLPAEIVVRDGVVQQSQCVSNL
jgi:hypothetical protein